MPVSGREHANAYGKRSADLCPVNRQSRRQMIGNMPQDAYAQQEREDEDGNLDQTGTQVRKHLNALSSPVECCKKDIQEQQETCDYKGQRDK
jgi:hypothetical protein